MIDSTKILKLSFKYFFFKLKFYLFSYVPKIGQFDENLLLATLNKLLPNVENFVFEIRSIIDRDDAEEKIYQNTMNTENILLKAVLANVTRKIKKITIILSSIMYYS